MKLVFDIDGVLCNEHDADVTHREPFMSRIWQINQLVEKEGYEVDIYTSRGMRSTGNDPVASDLKYRDITEKQLADWGVKYSKLYFGKPNADVYIDNKNALMQDFFEELRHTGTNSNS